MGTNVQFLSSSLNPLINFWAACSNLLQQIYSELFLLVWLQPSSLVISSLNILMGFSPSHMLDDSFHDLK
jgi:hypothetical protein